LEFRPGIFELMMPKLMSQERFWKSDLVHAGGELDKKALSNYDIAIR
jgi:hypothetical protein